MNWAWVALLMILPGPSVAGSIPESTHAHLKLLEERLNSLPPGRAREKILAEILRIRREYKLDEAGAGTSGASPSGSASPARRAAEAYQKRKDNPGDWEKKKKEFQDAAEEELKGRQESWQKSKNDFMSAAEEELRRRQGAARAYAGQAEWTRAYNSNLSFAQKPVRLGGLGYDFAEAQDWVKRVMARQPPAAIAAFRARYEKAVAFAQLPKEQGGLGYVRAYARKVAVEVAEKPTLGAVDEWIAKNRGAAARSAGSCRSWFSFFSK